MSEHLYYHFWSLNSDASPLDNETDYSKSSVANDAKFLQEFKDYRVYVKFSTHEDYALKLLGIYFFANLKILPELKTVNHVLLGIFNKIYS